ncbi:MAG: hypothetical protein LC713_01650, partial [Actinobacteria bacterium]|nr:hypothetical protein [Actinomycetota bacterium]
MTDVLQLEAVQRDDVLLDRIAEGDLPADADAVCAGLAAWSRHISTAPEPPPAVPASMAEPEPEFEPSARRLTRPVIVGLILVGAIASSGGVAAAAAQAGPGSVLWPVTKIVAPRHAESMEAARDILAAVSKARQLAGQGESTSALRTLQHALDQINKVGRGDGRSTLRAQVTELQAALRDSAPIDAVPPTEVP